MKKTMALLVVFLGAWAKAQAADPVGYTMPRTDVVPVVESSGNRLYELYIKLPEGYEKTADRRYPVIYTTDAVWHMDLLSGTTEYLLPDVILVGISWQKDIDRTLAFEEEGEWVHASRYRDYTTVKLDDPARQAVYQTGHAPEHLSFIRNDVIPLVDAAYRTKPNERAYLGYSLGAAFGAYILLAEPDSFQHYILGAPALGQRSFGFLETLATPTAPQQITVKPNVFIAIGDQEREQRMTVTRDLVSLLERRQPAGLVLTELVIIKDSDHGTAVPETFMRSIKWLSDRLGGE